MSHDACLLMRSTSCRFDGEDPRGLPLMQRKRRLARIVPRVESRLLFLDAIPPRGERLFEIACERDLESIVAN
jgi:ATP-dependent DNA ligase